MKMFRKYQLAGWLSIRNFYSHFTKVTRKCECFGCIVEPCKKGINIVAKIKRYRDKNEQMKKKGSNKNVKIKEVNRMTQQC